MTTALTLRAELAEAIRPIVGDSVNVYEFPAETVALPAVVLVPASPYWVPGGFGSGTMSLKVMLQCQLIVPRTEVSEAFDNLETLAVAVGLAIQSVPVCRFIDLSGVEPIEVNELAALYASVGLEARV